MRDHLGSVLMGAPLTTGMLSLLGASGTQALSYLQPAPCVLNHIPAVREQPQGGGVCGRRLPGLLVSVRRVERGVIRALSPSPAGACVGLTLFLSLPNLHPTRLRSSHKRKEGIKIN